MQQRVLHILVLFRDDTNYFVSECIEISSFFFKNFFFSDIVFLLLCLLVTEGQSGKLLYHIIM